MGERWVDMWRHSGLLVLYSAYFSSLSKKFFIISTVHIVVLGLYSEKVSISRRQTW